MEKKKGGRYNRLFLLEFYSMSLASAH